MPSLQHSSHPEITMQRPAIVANAYLLCVSSKSVVEDRYFAEAECEKRGIKFRWLKILAFPIELVDRDSQKGS
jgi:hypothetical protein